jgi:hypothetical protein
MRIFKSAALFTVLLYPAVTRGTAIFATYQDGALFVGADTLQKIMIYRPSGTIYADNHDCKLYVGPRAVVSTNGASDGGKITKSTATSITVASNPVGELLDNVLESEIIPQKIIERLRKDIKRWQATKLQKIQKKDWAVSTGQLITVTVFYLDDRARATLMSITFSPKIDKGVLISDMHNDGPHTFGENGQRAYMATPFSYHASLTSQRFVDSLNIYPDAPTRLTEALKKESEISKDPQAGFVVGPPYTIFRLGVMGGTWMPGTGAEVCKAHTHLATKQ